MPKNISMCRKVLLVSEKQNEDPRKSKPKKDQEIIKLKNKTPYTDKVQGRRVQLTSVVTTLFSRPPEPKFI